jgi:uncharacterized repeat protein (TIGR03803 family)
MKVLRIGCVFGGFLSLALSVSAQTFTTLDSFNGTNGRAPFAGLVQAINGNLYGTAWIGGNTYVGTVFKITPGGALAVARNFRGSNGSLPRAPLIQSTDGALYGTTEGGGTVNLGTVFEITPSGTLTTLHSFLGTDGSEPLAALVEASNGNFYGTTSQGGPNYDGTVFEITPNGTLTTLYNFCSQTSCTDGAGPWGGLIQATDGNFYGTTQNGGANTAGCGGYGCGTVFKVTPSGTLTTLYNFCSRINCRDGANPDAGLIQATDGSLYGTTQSGGANNLGTVFRFTPSGTLIALHSFAGTDGSAPYGALIQASDGNLYGTTQSDGANSGGTIFEITPGGTLTTLYNFCAQANCMDGGDPSGTLVQATDGTFYGTTQGGGTLEFGTIFSLSVGLLPFVETLPTSGRVGTDVKILGTNLTGSTSVTFNGAAATFTVVSSSEITATVPSGAATGKVEVVTSGGTLTSNVNFRVLQ